MVVELAKDGVETVMPRVQAVAVKEKPEDQYAIIGIGSEWNQDNQDLQSAVPDPVPEGFVVKAEWVTTTNRNKQQVRRLIYRHTAGPRVAPKPGAVVLDAMTDDQIRNFAAEKNIKLPKETETPLRRDQLLSLVQKGLGK